MPSGAQLSLIEPPPPADEVTRAPVLDPSATPTPVAPPKAPEPPTPPALALKAPLRLNPAVRDALASVVETLNVGASPVAACTVANGLFIPLHELERRGIQPALALRALADVRMLVHADRARPPTVSRDFGGDMTVGLVIDPRFIDGFDLAGFVLAEPVRD